jgi:hypothetical protein
MNLPRLSLWKDEKHSADYKFIDRRVSEMFTIGGTGVYVHKYLGTYQSAGTDATQPAYNTVSEKNIQDLLFLENRDRKYDKNIYRMRGVYNVQDIDFDLRQFGLFLSNDTLFIQFHLNDMVDILGRKLMSGDVLELPHLKDFFPLDTSLPAALKRYYVIQDATKSSEGFSPTWWGHLWRVKCTPLVDSQEYRDILGSPNDPNSLKNLLGTYQRDLAINQAIVDQALNEVPESGYDTTPFYVVPTKTVELSSLAQQEAKLLGINLAAPTLRELTTEASDDAGVTDGTTAVGNGYTLGYLTGDGIPPNGEPVTTGIEFPGNPSPGDFCLRLDYFPNRLFRFDGNIWVKIEDAVRTSQTPGESQALMSGFVNNTATTNTPDGPIDQKQALSKLLRPRADN